MPSISDKTYALARTLPSNASNVKLVITSSATYLETIDSSSDLASSLAKGFAFDHSKSLSVNYAIFCKAFSKRSSIDNLWLTKSDLPAYVTSFDKQYFELYQAGGYSDTQVYIHENFRYFAPIFLNDRVPDAFVIRRVVKTDNNGYQKSEILASFDLSTKSSIGQTLRSHLVALQASQLGVYTNFKSISYTGTDAINGTITTKSITSLMTDPVTDRPLIEFDEAIADGWSKTNLIDTRYLNLEFCFDLQTAQKSDFETIVGDYVYLTNESSDLQAYYLPEDRVMPLFDTQQTAIDKVVSTVKCLDNRTDLPAIAEFRIVTDHTPNSRFALRFDGEMQVDVLIPAFTGSLVSVIDYYVSYLSTALASSSTSVDIRIVRDGSILRLISNALHETFQDIEIVAYPSEWRLLDERVTVIDRFKRPSSKTVILTTRVDTSSIHKIRYNGQTRNVIDSYSYDNLYVLVLDTPLSTFSNVNKVELLSVKSAVLSNFEELERRDFVYDFRKSDYSNVLDFDLDQYRAFLTTFIESDDWSGNDADLPVIRAGIAKYFNSIASIDRSLLLNNIDQLTKEFTTIDNQYERYDEVDTASNSIKLLSPKTSLYQHRFGLDVYGNPYTFNSNIAYRYDNFSPLALYTRNLAYHTHSWLVIGHGQPPYAATSTQYHGYSKASVTRTDLANGDFSNLPFSQVYRTNNDCFVFFRGALLRTPVSYEGYKFTAVLLANEPLLTTDRSIEVLINDEQKTIAVLVRVYLPEPILCSGGDSSKYWLDRSLLYFVDSDYSLTTSPTVLGSSRISLDFYDNETIKYFNGMPVGLSWLYDDKIHVSSNRSIAPVDLRSIIQVNTDFEVFFGDIDDVETTLYGMSIVFQDIQEVSRSSFWCSEIKITYKETISFVTTEYEKFLKSEWLSNNNIFDEDNQYAIARYLCMHNARFERTLSNIASIDRYSLLSSASIFDELSSISELTYISPTVIKTTLEGSDVNIELARYPSYYDLTTKVIDKNVPTSMTSNVLKFSTNLLSNAPSIATIVTDTLSLRNYFVQYFNETFSQSISWTSYMQEIRNVWFSKVYHYVDEFVINLELSNASVRVANLYEATARMTVSLYIPGPNQEAIDHVSLHTINRIYKISKIISSFDGNEHDYTETYDSYVIRSFTPGVYQFTITRR